MKIVELELKDLVIPQGLLPRVLTGTVEEKVEEYKELLEEGVEFDPIQVWEREDGQYWVVDGVHRVEAHKRAGRERIKAKLIKCKDELDYRIKAIQANLKHGLALAQGERPELARILYRQGMKEEEVRKVFGVSQDTVRKWLAPVKQEEKEKKIRKALELREKGWKIKDIAKELGVPESTVKDWLRTKMVKDTKIVLLTPTGDPTAEGLKHFSDYVLSINNSIDFPAPDLLVNMLREKGYELSFEEADEFLKAVLREIKSYISRLVNSGLKLKQIQEALIYEREGIFEHLTTPVKKKLALLFTDYIRKQIEKKEKEKEIENKVVALAREILSDPRYIFSNWRNLAKQIMEKLEEAGEGISHRYTPSNVAQLLQKHSDELMEIYNSIPEITEEELKEFVKNFRPEDFNGDIDGFRDTIEEEIIKSGKRPAGAYRYATYIYHEYEKNKWKNEDHSDSSRSPSLTSLAGSQPALSEEEEVLSPEKAWEKLQAEGGPPKVEFVEDENGMIHMRVLDQEQKPAKGKRGRPPKPEPEYTKEAEIQELKNIMRDALWTLVNKFGWETAGKVLDEVVEEYREYAPERI